MKTEIRQDDKGSSLEKEPQQHYEQVWGHILAESITFTDKHPWKESEISQ